MILNTKDESSSFRQTFLLCLTAPVSEATFLRRAKVRVGTYAGDLMAQLHGAIFKRSLELKSDYATYFAREYSTFGEYVSKLFRLSDDVVKEVERAYNVARLILHYEASLYFLEGDYGRDFLTKL